MDTRDAQIRQVQRSHDFSLVTSVRTLQRGVTSVDCDTVLFEHAPDDPATTYQMCSRAGTTDPTNPGKIATIICPVPTSSTDDALTVIARSAWRTVAQILIGLATGQPDFTQFLRDALDPSSATGQCLRVRSVKDNIEISSELIEQAIRDTVGRCILEGQGLINPLAEHVEAVHQSTAAGAPPSKSRDATPAQQRMARDSEYWVHRWAHLTPSDQALFRTIKPTGWLSPAETIRHEEPAVRRFVAAWWAAIRAGVPASVKKGATPEQHHLWHKGLSLAKGFAKMSPDDQLAFRATRPTNWLPPAEAAAAARPVVERYLEAVAQLAAEGRKPHSRPHATPEERAADNLRKQVFGRWQTLAATEHDAVRALQPPTWRAPGEPALSRTRKYLIVLAQAAAHGVVPASSKFGHPDARALYTRRGAVLKHWASASAEDRADFLRADVTTDTGSSHVDSSHVDSTRMDSTRMDERSAANRTRATHGVEPGVEHAVQHRATRTTRKAGTRRSAKVRAAKVRTAKRMARPTSTARRATSRR